VKNKLIRLAGEMGAYAGTNPTPPADKFDKSTLEHFLSENVAVQDLSGRICRTQTSSTDPPPKACNADSFTTVAASTLMTNFVAAGFTRFGCLMPGSDSVAYLLAILTNPKDTTKGYQLSDALAMHVWLDDNQKAYRFLISNEDDIIAAAISANQSYCGDLIFKSVGGTNPDQSGAGARPHPH
jgi:hypothetical protein